ncbi:M28 family peptidase [Aliifodinibius salicampi]|uniref:M28 family peptidase n=1 Tax=Fodinibius salicampi TaxID=1920655 RepID=A0ABT3PVP2_9BACT|nr:M28 family peptidase [Fodinibius salicampi]MCW9711898.1 M28 family peptidase [Fodinibius salicampi]
MVSNLLSHIKQVAECPSFSTYEERLHPYIYSVFESITDDELIVEGNNLVFRLGNNPNKPTIALTAHLDKINHYGKDYPDLLPVAITDHYIEGAMDNSVGVGLLLYFAGKAKENPSWPNLLFFFSEMEESKGLKEHPDLLKNNGKDFDHGMGARRIAQACIDKDWLPDQVITLDTTPLFKGKQGIALYAKHWELNGLEETESLRLITEQVVQNFLAIDSTIQLHNNTNDYLHYGYEFNAHTGKDIISIALEPAIYPYHQKGERVFIEDLMQLVQILKAYLKYNDKLRK